MQFANRVKEVCSGSGTGSLTLAGPTDGTFFAFADYLDISSDTAKRIPYTLISGDEKEVGYGRLTGATTFTRDIVLESSNGDGKIELDGSRQHIVFVALPWQNVFVIDENGAIANADPLRKAVTLASVTAMQAAAAPKDGVVIRTRYKSSLDDGLGGEFWWDEDDATAPDNVDTFRNGALSTGLYKRILNKVSVPLFAAALTIGLTTGTAAQLKSYTDPHVANANSYFYATTDGDFDDGTTAHQDAWRFGARRNQSAEVDFVRIYSPGTADDRFEIRKPIVLPTISDFTGITHTSLAVQSGRLRYGTANGAFDIPLTLGYFDVVCNTYAQLKGIVADGLSDGSTAWLLGAGTLGDGNECAFRWSGASTATDNNVTVLRPTVGSAATGAGRWLKNNSLNSGSFTSTDATPSVANGNFYTTSGTTPITMFDDGFERQVIIIARGASDITITHDPTKILCAGGENITLTLYRRLVAFEYVNGVWYEIGQGRSDILIARAFGSGDATPSVLYGRTFVTAGSTTITAFDDGITNQIITVIRGASDISIANNSNITTISGGTLTLTASRPAADFRYSGTAWVQISSAGGAAVAGTSLGWISITDQGALTDGSSDDIVAIHAARDAAGANGVVYVPPGTTRYSTSIALNVAGQTWVLAAGATLKMQDAGTISSGALNVTAASVSILGSGHGAGQSTIDGNRAHTGGYGVYVNSVDNFRIEGMRLVNHENNAVFVLNGSNWKVRKNYFQGIGSGTNGSACVAAFCSGTKYQFDFDLSENEVNQSGEVQSTETAGFLIRGDWLGLGDTGGPYGGKVRYNILRGVASPTGTISVGIEIKENCANIDVVGNDVYNYLIGISLGPGRRYRLIDNFSDSPTRYCFELAGTAGNMADAESTGNIGSTPAGYGFRITNADSIDLTGNLIFNPLGTMAGQAYCAAYSIYNTPNVKMTGNRATLLTAGTVAVAIDQSSQFSASGDRIRSYAASCIGYGVYNGSSSWNYTIGDAFMYNVTCFAHVSGTKPTILAVGNVNESGTASSGSPSITAPTNGNINIP